MTGGAILDEHHVVRLVGGSKIDNDMVHPSGFYGVPISVNWLECADGTKTEQLSRVRSLVRLKVRSSAKFAELNVGTIRGIVNGLDVVEDPLPANDDYPIPAPCHALIVGFPEDDDERKRIFEALADSIIGLY